MRFKRLLALLLAAALALSLLAGCGGGKALSQVIVDLLDNLYSNVSVEADSDLTAALKQAAAEGGTEEEILSRMIEILNHKGGSITFTLLGSGQQGNHAVTLYFQTGTDPNAAARNALAQWAGTLGTLPDDGSYQADVAMIETENGYYVALDVEVLKAGKPDKPDKDDDKEPTPDPQPQDSVVDNGDGTFTHNVATEKGFMDWAEAARKSPDSTNCTLLADIDLTNSGDWTPITNFNSTFDGGNHSITGLTVNRANNSHGAMFAVVMSDGTVKNLTLTDVNITSTLYVGSIAGVNYGSIENCSADGEISGTVNVGGIIGYNSSESVKNCSFSGSVSGDQAVGGVVGSTLTSSITNCHSSATVTGTSSRIGGVVGNNSSSGGVVTACYHAIGAVRCTNTIPEAGGVVGRCYGKVVDCYWSGDVTLTPDSSGTYKPHGLGSTTDQNHSASNDNATLVDNTTTWDMAMTTMNEELSSRGYSWQYQPGTSGAPLTLTQK